VYLILEYLPHAKLLVDILVAYGPMPERTCMLFMDQLLDATEYMHSRNVIHRDLKLNNILIDQCLNLKVIDFGLAANYNIERLISCKGSDFTIAPEIVEGKIYDGRKADIFSLGVIFYTLLQGTFPFIKPSKNDLHYNLIINGQYEQFWKFRGCDGISDEFKDLFNRMISYDPAHRPFAHELRHHPFM